MPYDLTLFELTDEQKVALQASEGALEHLKQRRVPVIRASDHFGMASWALESWCQLWLGRSIELIEGMQSEWNGRRLLSAVVLLRAFIETIAAHCNIVDKGRNLLPKEELRGFHKSLMSAMFGARMQTEGGELPAATNVLTLIAKLEKSFPRVERFYTSLCEAAHPNIDGLMCFANVDLEKHEMQIGAHPENLDFFTQKLVGGARMIEVAAFWSVRCDREIRPAVAALEKQHGPNPSDWPT